jgi:hypothetical protein
MTDVRVREGIPEDATAGDAARKIPRNRIEAGLVLIRLFLRPRAGEIDVTGRNTLSRNAASV